MLAFLAKLLGGGLIDRVLDTVDRRIENEANRDKIKGDLLKTHMESREGFMRAGGSLLMLLFAVPLAFWFSAVVVYSVFWCAGCAYPQEWTIAALPSPLDEWAGLIIIAIFGVVGFTRFKR